MLNFQAAQHHPDLLVGVGLSIDQRSPHRAAWIRSRVSEDGPARGKTSLRLYWGSHGLKGLLRIITVIAQATWRYARSFLAARVEPKSETLRAGMPPNWSTAYQQGKVSFACGMQYA